MDFDLYRTRIAGFLAALLLLAFPAMAQHLRIYYPDIEQGSSTLVVSPTGQGMLIDAGTELDATDDDVILFLEDLIDQGILTSLDYVVATHYDEDHIGRLDHVLSYGPVAPTVVTYDRGEFGGVPSTFAYGDYAFHASSNNRTTIAPGTVINLGGGVTVECVVVNAELPDATTVDLTGVSQFENNVSVGLVVRYGHFDAWIGGDLTGNPTTGVADVETPTSGFTGDVDVYTVNHHGSRTSSNANFLSTLKAEIAINQSSASNNFGHPNTEVVNRFLGTPDTFSNTPLFLQLNPGNPTDTRSDDTLAAGIADPDDVDEARGLPGSVLVISDSFSYRVAGGAIAPISRVADSGSGPLADFPPAILLTSQGPLVPTAAQAVTVQSDVRDEGAVTAEILWALDGVAQAPIAMSLSGGLYEGTIPAQADGTLVTYRVRATDGLAQVELGPEQGYYAGVTPIDTIRQHDAQGLLLTRRLPVRVEGNLTAEPGIFHPFVSQIYVQDDAGAGVQVFDRTLLALARGERVQFTGRIEQFSGQAEVNISEVFGNFGFTSLGAGTAPAPQVLTASQIGEATEGKLVRINNLTVVSGTIPESGNGNLIVTDDGGITQLTVRIDGDTGIPGANTPNGTFDLIGISSQFDPGHPFDFGYQVLPREREDFLTDEVNLPTLLIHEIHADPDGTLAGDANGDGVRDATDDEFVELVNPAGTDLDISGWTISDGVGVRHTFPANTILPAGEATVVFGGGTPTGPFGAATDLGLVFTASSGALGLNNTGDTVTVADALAQTIQQVTYGSEGGNDQSLTRDPDLTNSPFVLHSTADTVDGSLYSPGTRTLGGFFKVPAGAVILTEVLYDAVSTDDGFEWVELYNASSVPVDLSTMSLGSGGGDYTTSQVQLAGTIQPGTTFVVGGPNSGTENGNPSFDQVENFSPDFQNSGTDGDGVALFNVRASQVGPATVPVDAVVYGPNNNNGLLDETGTANAPEVGDAGSGQSIERIDEAGAWQIRANPDPNAWSPGTPPPPPAEGLLLSEVIYDVDGGDDGFEWIELYNSGSETIDLASFSIAYGGTSYGNPFQLSGTVAPGETFVVGGPTSSSVNANPSFDQVENFSSDLQNSGSEGDGIALFAVPATQWTSSTVPIDAVIYGPNNNNGLIDETGSANAPEVGDAPAGSSIERTDLAGAWQIQSTPTPNASSLGGGGGGATPVHVDSIDPTDIAAGGPNRAGRATVTIVDDVGNPVSGVEVFGTFSGDFNESQSAFTDGSGVAVIDSQGKVKGMPSFTFCVDDVVGASVTYDDSADVESCDGI